MIEFTHNGRLWRTDTEDEAIRLRQKLEAYDQALWESGEEPDELHEQLWTPDLTTELLQSAGQHQRELLRLLHKGRAESETIVKTLGLRSEVALAGVLSGLSKQLKKLGLKPWNLYTVSVQWDGKNKTRTFTLSNDFTWAAEQLGWPDKW